ncbi:SSI family serine proteinase inhibitor [Streptomyces sp. TRM 70361]|uniref:SSI family serine proteinase inhibitor n=1 Tax=Streptomyces sp. TRM 70361 TaxID=3116553 RepID=UPI002E7AB2A0|nr:SSI family serine proteinase inhibitor [Streptomyces sp. TRM 70361]MEE1939656.1 SSI family serine proteinase inhibitor [Streptomyces sp. TRM 70361]
MPRHRTTAVLAGTVLAGTAVLSAVAVPAAADTVRPRPGHDTHRPVASPARQDQLTFTVTESKPVIGGTTRTQRRYTLHCHPAGGSHPDPLAACEALDRADDGPASPWEPVPPGTPCAQIYGGPATARVTGTWRGRPVNAAFDRTDGCEIARWDALVPALPDQRK